MDIMELGAIGELVGGVAVIGSLIYVGLQVRHSAEQTRQTNAIAKARAHRETERSWTEVFCRTDERLLEIYRTALMDFESLPLNEQALLHHRYLIPVGINITATFHAAREGLIERAWAEEFIKYWARVVSSPGISYWWDQMKDEFDPAFTVEIERLQADPGVIVPITTNQTWLRLGASGEA